MSGSVRMSRCWLTNPDGGHVPLRRHFLPLPMKSFSIALVCLAVIGSGAGPASAAGMVDIQYQITAASFTLQVGPNTYVVVAAAIFGGDFTLRSAGKRRQVSHRGRICPIY